jgi:hypothetical protein
MSFFSLLPRLATKNTLNNARFGVLKTTNAFQSPKVNANNLSIEYNYDLLSK